MGIDACQQCGAPVVQPRSGSRAKRFCSNVCRARFNRGRRPSTIDEAPPASPPTDDDRAERRRALQHIHDELWADIAARGSMIDGRVNPAVEALRKVGAELERYSSVEVQQAPADPIEAALRAVS